MKKILVAEDTESNFLLLSIILRKDYEILRAFNGAEAVEICRSYVVQCPGYWHSLFLLRSS